MGNVFFSGCGTGVVSVLSGIPTSVCTNLSEVRSGNSVTLKWQDPVDTIIDGKTLATWGHTIIVRKQGGYPKHESDGDVIYTNTIRNKHASVGFVDTIETIGEDKYYYRAFPITVNGVVNLDPLNKFGIEMYEFVINPNDSNPATSVSYRGTNASYTPAKMNFTSGQFEYGSWANAFFMKLFKPCMLKSNGEVDYYLNPNNYALKENGEESDIANTDYDGNGMVEVGQIWISEHTVGDEIHVRIANGKVDDSFDCYTHLKPDGTCRKYIYRALYDGGLVDGKIRSIAGLTPCGNQTGQNQIKYAKANGAGWNIDEYSFRRMLNYLLVLIGKSLNTQAVFGKGVQDGGEAGKIVSGTLNDKGMFYGYNVGTKAVKLFHIENWWGNVWILTNGLFANYGKLLYKMVGDSQLDGSTVTNYNENGNGYIDSGVTISGSSGGCIKTMKLVPGLGLVPASVTGSNSTYYADGCWFNVSASPFFARFGANSNYGLTCGAFACALTYSLSSSYWLCGVSLSYKSAS